MGDHSSQQPTAREMVLARACPVLARQADRLNRCFAVPGVPGCHRC
jgi:hypothetical protein